jgi:exodeoxyribonuclease III
VVTSSPPTALTGLTQDRTTSPRMITEQAPHCAIPHPNRGPLRPRLSLRTNSRGVSGSTSTVWSRPFTFSLIRFILPVSVGRGRDPGCVKTGSTYRCSPLIDNGLWRHERLKIATFNINNVNKRLYNLTAWLARAEPDVVCLQELKAEQHAFPEDALCTLGYRAVWLGERSWNGVAILARGVDPILTRISLPGRPEDPQARYIEAAVKGVLIASIYLPNGNPQPGLKFDHKLAWLERLSAHAAELLAADVPVVLAGDYNVVPTVHDIYPTRSLDKNALIQPESRAAFARLLAQGWTDALRSLHPHGPLWTFWDYERGRWAADKGMRLDHLLLSPILRDRLVDGGVDRWARGEANASDHAPAWIVLDL